MHLELLNEWVKSWGCCRECSTLLSCLAGFLFGTYIVWRIEEEHARVLGFHDNDGDNDDHRREHSRVAMTISVAESSRLHSLCLCPVSDAANLGKFGPSGFCYCCARKTGAWHVTAQHGQALALRRRCLPDMVSSAAGHGASRALLTRELRGSDGCSCSRRPCFRWLHVTHAGGGRVRECGAMLDMGREMSNCLACPPAPAPAPACPRLPRLPPPSPPAP